MKLTSILTALLLTPLAVPHTAEKPAAAGQPNIVIGLADNTLVWFTSDNGGITPESQDPAGKGKMNIGVRTQGLLEWPARVKRQIRTEVVCGHVDMFGGWGSRGTGPPYLDRSVAVTRQRPKSWNVVSACAGSHPSYSVTPS
jgi:hypothetical protein